MEKITFTDPETNESVEFSVEEETQLNGIKYILVSEEISEDDCEAYILKEIKTEDEEILYEMVEDDVEFAALAKVFSELTDDDTTLEY
ncbi:MAG: DUF1292 domain-containing protein [Agathobacter sp.]|nr:DUF1292 domain-containing protein [Agathobacter sp.]